MCLNLSALTIVKMLGGEFASIQLVFLRACVGLLLILPFVLSSRVDLQLFSNIKLQLLRSALAAIALSFSFYAVSQLPIAFFTTLNFTRPLVLMFFAYILLREHISGMRWVAGAMGLLGAAIAANPGNVPWTLPMVALLVAIVAGTLSVIVLRQLKGSPWQTAMLYYAGGMILFTSIPALQSWQQPEPKQWVLLVCLAVFTQSAQFCFIRAHWLGEAGFLGPLGYTSLLLSAAIGFVFFDEIPTAATLLGACVIVAATLLLAKNNKVQSTVGGIR